MNHTKKKVRLHLYLSPQEWAHLQTTAKGSLYPFLIKQASEFFQAYYPQFKSLLEEEPEKECTERGKGKVGLRIILPADTGDFYQKLSRKFGVEAATFFVRFVLTPHLVNADSNVFNKEYYTKRPRKPI